MCLVIKDFIGKVELMSPFPSVKVESWAMKPGDITV